MNVRYTEEEVQELEERIDPNIINSVRFGNKFKPLDQMICPVKTQRMIDERFIGMKGIGKYLASCWNTNTYALMTGPGGLGKTQLAIAFFEWLNEDGLFDEDWDRLKDTPIKNRVCKPFIESVDGSYSEERFFGGIDFKEFTTTGRQVYNIDRSFINHPFVILDELGDGPLEVLNCLKVPLENKEVYVAGETHPLKCKFIIALSNINVSELETDRSFSALITRFNHKEYDLPEWMYREQHTYASIVSKNFNVDVGNTTVQDFAWIAQNISLDSMDKHEQPLNPRKCVQMFKNFLLEGVESIENTEIADKFKDLLKDRDADLQVYKGLTKSMYQLEFKVNEFIDEVKNTFEVDNTALQKIHKSLNMLDKMTCPPRFVKEFKNELGRIRFKLNVAVKEYGI